MLEAFFKDLAQTLSNFVSLFNLFLLIRALRSLISKFLVSKVCSCLYCLFGFDFRLFIFAIFSF